MELLTHYETKTLVKALNGIAGGGHSKGDSIESILKLCKTSTSIKSHFGGSKETLDEVALKRSVFLLRGIKVSKVSIVLPLQSKKDCWIIGVPC